MGDPSHDFPAAHGSISSTHTEHTARRTGKWAWEQAIKSSDLSPHARLLCLTLSTYMDVEGDNAFPSVETLAEVMGFGSKSPVYRAKREAVDAGYLSQSSGGGRGNSGTYVSTRYFATVPNGVSSDTVTDPTVSAAQPTVSLAVVNGVTSDTRPDHDQTKEQTSGEDASLAEFLDFVSSKVDHQRRQMLATERADPTNARRLRKIADRLHEDGRHPRTIARELSQRNGLDLNSATKSVLGFLLNVMKGNAA